MAHSLGSGLAGLSAPGKASPKNKSYMTIEPMKPKAPKSEVIVPPKKPGTNPASISPLQKAGPGWKPKFAIENPDIVKAPKVVSKA